VLSCVPASVGSSPLQHTRRLKPLSRQRLWQKQQVALGRCAICGNKRPSDLKILCRRCQDKANDLHMRIYYQNKARG